MDDFLGEGMNGRIGPFRAGSENGGNGSAGKDKFSRSDYMKARALLYYLIGGKSIDNLIFNMTYGNKDIVIRNRDGYHYGRLLGYDGKFFYLGAYHFDRELIDELSYIETDMDSLGSYKAAIPAVGVSSVSEIPSFIEDPAYA